MPPLTLTQREDIVKKICYFQAADIRTEFFEAIDLVKEDIKEEMDKLKEAAKMHRELIIDMVVCFLPKVVPDGLKKALTDEGIAALQELTKVVTKEKIFKDPEQDELEFIRNYVSVMAQGFRRRLDKLYDYLHLYKHNTTVLPDNTLLLLENKFLPQNFVRELIAEGIKEHLERLKRYVFSFGSSSTILQYESQTITTNRLELRPIKDYKKDIVYMPVFATDVHTKFAKPIMIYDYKSKTGSVQQETFLTIYDCIPVIFLDLALQFSREVGSLAFSETTNVLSVKDPKFLQAFYGKSTSSVLARNSKLRQEHFRLSLLRKSQTQQEWFGSKFDFVNYERIHKDEKVNFLQIESF